MRPDSPTIRSPAIASAALVGSEDPWCGRRRSRGSPVERSSPLAVWSRLVRLATIEAPTRRIDWASTVRWRSLAPVAPRARRGYLLARRRRTRYHVRYTNVDVLRGVAPRLSGWRERATVALVVGVLGLLCVGVARPHVNRLAPIENATVVLVIDTSRSMLSEDVAPTRLGAAKLAAQSFLDRAPGKLRIGLVTFAGDVSVGAAPTHDRERVKQSVASITRWQAGGGTAIGDALARAVELARTSFVEPGRAVQSAGAIPGAEGAVTILFLSDGRQNRGIIPRSRERRWPRTPRSPSTPWRSAPTTRTRAARRAAGSTAASTAPQTGRLSGRSRGRRGRVLRRALRRGTVLGVRRPRVAPWTGRAAHRGDVPVRRGSGRRARGCSRPVARLGAGPPLTASTSSHEPIPRQVTVRVAVLLSSFDSATSFE